MTMPLWKRLLIGAGTTLWIMLPAGIVALIAWAARP